MQLRIPGPTPVPPRILQTMTKPMINHRGKQFVQLIHSTTERLKGFFQTKSDVFILTASGTGGMEAAVVNTLSPGDQVLCLSNGYFGDRFTDIAQVYGAQVKKLEFPWGKAIDTQAVRQALKETPAIKAIIVVHNETSTGVTNDVAPIAALAQEFDKLILVDAISSLGSVDLPADKLGLDVVVTASQKGWMTPPGLAMISFGPRAWQAQAQARMPRNYFDLAKAKKFLDIGQTPWTPAVSAIFALAEALEVMAAEGLPQIVARHARVAKKAREGVKAMGLSIFPDEAIASNTVTAVLSPDGVDVKKMLRMLLDEYEIELASGQQKLDGKIFRIGHLGMVEETDIDEVLKGLATALPRAGYTKAMPKWFY